MYHRTAFLLSLMLLTACKNSGASQSALVSEAQGILDRTNQGRACTALTKTQLETTIDRDNPEFAKRQVLAKHGAVTIQKASNSTGMLDWQVYQNKPLKEADGNGVFFADGGITYYCFGKWHVTAAEESDKLEVPAGKRLLIATVELKDTVPWINSDPAASALAVMSRGDPNYVPALNEYDKLVPMSYTKPNRTPLLADKKE